MGILHPNEEDERQERHFILWKSLQFPGHEACRMFYRASQWHMEGIAVFLYDSQACQLTYSIRCNSNWQTHSARVRGWVGARRINLALNVDAGQRWWLNQVEVPGVAGCVDLDLNFSPSTNTVAIRRLKLAVNEKREIQAAWLRFPSFSLEVLPQSYRRLRHDLYLYQSGGGRFSAKLEVDESGLVLEYPEIWKSETVRESSKGPTQVR
jgi:hypothetical protein